MNLLLLTENWPPRIGGIERYLVGLTEGLRNEGVTVHVIEPSTHRIFWPIIKPAWLPLFIYIWKFVKREKIDVLLCGKALFEGLIGFYLKKYLNIPYVVFTYAMEIETWHRDPRTRRNLERVLQGATRVIVINDVTKNQVIDMGVSEERIVKIYPAVDEQFMKNVRNARGTSNVREKYDLKNPYILTVARLIPRKGIDDLIRAFATFDQMKFGNIDLVIVGDGPYKAELERIAEGEFVRPRFLGAVPDEDLPGLFSHARIFALTPKNIDGDIEGYGIVYLEAATAGLPILATRTGGVPEAVKPLQNHILVDSGNPTVIAKALTALLEKETIRVSIGNAPRYRERAQELLTILEQIG